MSDDLEMGNDNTLYGKVSAKRMGSRNTVVGPTDDKGNTIILPGTSVGFEAGSDPTSIMIGSGAGRNIGKKKAEEKED